MLSCLSVFVDSDVSVVMCLMLMCDVCEVVDV